jgi:hypothetical protein
MLEVAMAISAGVVIVANHFLGHLYAQRRQTRN